MLRENWLTPKASNFDESNPSYASCMKLHEAAIAANSDTYIDPSTGRMVKTAVRLAQRECCNEGCRHCPWKDIESTG